MRHDLTLPATALTLPFWKGIENGQFLLQYDATADSYQFHPRPISLYSPTTDLAWRPASGKGQLVAHTLCHKPAPGYESIAPYWLGIVELAEGPRVFAPLALSAQDRPKIGQAFELCYGYDAPGPAPFAFRPAMEERS